MLWCRKSVWFNTPTEQFNMQLYAIEASPSIPEQAYLPSISRSATASILNGISDIA